MEEILIFNGSQYYSDLLDSFSHNKKFSVDLDKTDLSSAMYYHICRMKLAGWRHRINFKRNKKHTFSEFFQDLVAFYLKKTLPDEYEVELESCAKIYTNNKSKNINTDILIRKNGKNHFIIETKTSIGWMRPNFKEEDPYLNLKYRITNLEKAFNLSSENIIYVFEDHGNVSIKFSKFYWDKTSNKPVHRPNNFPLSAIYPLFNAPDPFYWTYPDSQTKYIEYTYEQLIEASKNNIVSPFENVIKKIIA